MFKKLLLILSGVAGRSGNPRRHRLGNCDWHLYRPVRRDRHVGCQ